jgi:SAM-dependent methyltransferase
VLDLGSGSGTDSFAAGVLVGAEGHVTGVDMTDEQLAKANALRDAAGMGNVEFVRGYNQDPAVPDASVDLVITNGVINMAPDKAAVCRFPARGQSFLNGREGQARRRTQLALIASKEMLLMPYVALAPCAELDRNWYCGLSCIVVTRSPASSMLARYALT